MKANDYIDALKHHVYDNELISLYEDAALLPYQTSRMISALETFISLYGDMDVTLFSTPGRSEVCGNHTDHQHGEVLAAAINLDMIAVAAKAETIKVQSDAYDIREIKCDDLDVKPDETGTSEALIRGVLHGFTRHGYKIGGFKAFITSDVLQGSGLSSSAAFEVMIATILNGLYNDEAIDPVAIAKIGQYSENVYFGKPCGLMDQCACAVGCLIHIDFQDPTAPFVEKIDVDFGEFDHRLCIVDVHASHADLTQDYADIPAEMKAVAHYFNQDFLRDVDEQAFYAAIPALRHIVSDRAILRSIHLFHENRRVSDAVSALKAHDFPQFRKAVTASGNSSYKYLQNIYAAHDYAHQAVSLALALSEHILQDHGFSRVHGGGFAGTIQAFVASDYVAAYKSEIEKVFGEGSCHVLQIRQKGSAKIL